MAAHLKTHMRWIVRLLNAALASEIINDDEKGGLIVEIEQSLRTHAPRKLDGKRTGRSSAFNAGCVYLLRIENAAVAIPLL